MSRRGGDTFNSMTRPLELPLITQTEATHIGTLKAADKGIRGRSYEGHGLSVSICPEEWERIAKLGGLPWWQLENPDGRFLDAHALTEKQQAEIASWGLELGLVEWAELWELSFDDDDDELDDTVSFLFASKDEAELELEEREGSSLKQVGRWCGTEQLAARIGFASELDSFALLLPLYVEENLAGVDGVWWEDILDGYLSAPRGVIVPGHLCRWTRQRIG